MTRKEEKSIVNVTISNQRKKLKPSMLEEILNQEQDAFFETTGKPIIVVPSQVNEGNLCILNAKRFLRDGRYRDAAPLLEKARQEDNVKEKESFRHKINMKTSYDNSREDREIVFEVYDSVTTFSKKDWKRVIAVFLSGHDW